MNIRESDTAFDNPDFDDQATQEAEDFKERFLRIPDLDMLTRNYTVTGQVRCEQDAP